MNSTPLNAEHVRLGARMVDFAGWHMPVQYKGIIEEHKNVRTNVGLFDVSHMGEVFVRGPKSLETLQYLTTNDVAKLTAGQAQYSLLLNKTGGLVDDIIVYCLKPSEEYLVCVNASNATKDFDWMKANNKGAEITNESTQWAQIAIQGPKAPELVSRILGSDVQKIKYYNCAVQTVAGARWIVARTGYTGEDGYEVFLPAGAAVGFWQDLLKKGEDLGVQPIGLGARDTLRTEMKYSLYGHEITDEISPLEAGLGWVIKMDKANFIGKDWLAEQKARGLKYKLVGFKMVDKGIPRQGYSLFSFDKTEIGKVTSGTMSPSLNEPIGIGFVLKEMASEGTEFAVSIRDRLAKAVVVKTPFVKPSTKGDS